MPSRSRTEHTVAEPNDSAPGEVIALATRLRNAVVPLFRQLRQQASEPFTPTQLAVIGVVHRHGPLSLSEISSRERLSLASISKVVASLEEEGMVSRQTDCRDARITLVQATPRCVQWIESGRSVRDAWLADRIERLGAAERRTLLAAVELLEGFIDSDD